MLRFVSKIFFIKQQIHMHNRVDQKPAEKCLIVKVTTVELFIKCDTLHISHGAYIQERKRNTF